ncbi:MAG TPA: hypothetical protein DCS88_10660 [Alphaproteobacteria bacterium]|nr:hypothetical protein [Alphaproteobacteria bacterium]
MIGNKKALQNVAVDVAHLSSEGRQPTRRKPIIITVFLIFSVISCGIFWVWHQSQPITTQEIVNLNALIDRAAKSRHLPPQRISADFWRQFEIRATANLTRSQHDAAQAYLIRLAQ